jgi:ketosteroid isomerase-like protein
MSNANVDLVQAMYAAFGRGDIATIINATMPDIDWETVGRKTDFPDFGPRRGQSEVREFFGIVSKELNFSEFTPKEFHAVDDKVFVLGHYKMTVTKTGKTIDSDWVHIFTIRNGKVTSFREFLDTAQAAEAYR